MGDTAEIIEGSGTRFYTRAMDAWKLFNAEHCSKSPGFGSIVGVRAGENNFAAGESTKWKARIPEIRPLKVLQTTVR